MIPKTHFASLPMATCWQCVSCEIVTCVTRATCGHVVSVLTLAQLWSPLPGASSISGILRETVTSDAGHAADASPLLKNDLDQSIKVGDGINFCSVLHYGLVGMELVSNENE